MAEVIWGLATSHVPSIGAAMDRQKTDDTNWKDLFDGYAPARAWLAEHRPDVVGHPELSLHLVESMIDEGFDLTVFQELQVDHGFTVPLSVWTPDPGDAWPCPVIPLLVNVIQYPQPTAARCWALGQALGRAIRSYPDDLTVGVLGTGGMSHQLAGTRAGFINPEFDAMWMEAIEKDPAKLAALSREELIRQAGSEGIELIMWLIMRGAMNEQIRKVHSDYFVPASNTAAGIALFDNRVSQPA